ncbi:D-alanyl-D-alanine carboxypeptidase (penicillin-binding protein 5/6) [Rubritalea squalenifaciens DSM 18772]|uniref:D-alanyl-D-alanine carboxypeptidase (Penicillin-binding protein 5/6) n=1 Tax=Rubritalea squalenifaciens DSM 18772 TaxID=1123071 RepID=A0A1M6DY23_9BACT|nr:D-alanyl-D-alanine carboxypeptidase family protein [Rubritalea squalenifaciens]SHI78146.1 D-alanyl-D-alanine carboxypeptidase (penicillin-binding protein 5/6) [Rubritalea squalenifaciens DSM 18772]
MISRFLMLSFLSIFTISCSSTQTIAQQGVDQTAAQEPVRIATIPRSQAPSVYAKRAIVVDYDTGRILHEKNAHQRCAIASTQKLLTALCVLDAGSTQNKVTVQKTDTLVEPTKIYIKPGETYTRYDLLKALTVKSGNDVARALARDVAGSQQSFANVMNRKARSLGMRNSHFVNPHGLTENGQYSTAYDLAILSRAAFSNPTIRSFTHIKGYYFFHPDGKRKWLDNTNKVLKRVPYCNGMKTGTTKASGRCLVSSGTYNGRTAIVVVLGSNSANVWSDSEKLLRWALERPAAQ